MPVRIVVTLGIVAYLVMGLRRRILYPLRRPFGRDDVALAVERRFPELHQRLISAHQLEVAAARGDLRDQSAAMVQRLLDQAADEVKRLPLGTVLDPRRTVRVWAVAGTALVLAFGVLAVQPDYVWTMLKRALGFAVDYPRQTTLHIELPKEDSDYRIEQGNRESTVTLAAGADLPVLVRADGVVPREVYLVVEGARGMAPEIATTRRPGDRFRHVFRQVQGEFSFHARGGDDPHGDLVVHVRTVRPPLVGTIAAELTYPAYTGKAPETQPGGTIEALVGTHVRLTVTATEAVEHAALVFLEGTNEVPLEPQSIEDDSGVRRRFAADFTITASDRYEVHLEGAQGLRNPKPGTYPIVAVEDHAPVGRMLLPSGDDIHVVVPGALVPLRVEAKDDFGLASVDVKTSTGREEIKSERALLPKDGAARPTDVVVADLLPLDELTPGRAEGPRAGETISLAVDLADNKSPDAGHTELSRREVHVVAESDLLRRISTHFRRLRESVEGALDIQRERHDTLEAVMETPPAPGAAARDARLVSVEVGQGRVLSNARRIREGLMQAYDTHLFNHLEAEDAEQAKRVVDLYLTVQREITRADPWLPEFYRKVAEEQHAGRIGSMAKTLDPILAMTLGADAIVEQYGKRAVDELEAAGVASDATALTGHLKSAFDAQTAIEQELQTLLSKLDEWNEYQDVIQQARALRDAQRDVESRTKTIKEGGR